MTTKLGDGVIIPKYIGLSLRGPMGIKGDDMRNQFQTRGFILWPATNSAHIFEHNALKYGTFRQFYSNCMVKLFAADNLLRCEYNTKKGLKYLKLLHNSYVGRLANTFNALPDVLLNIISSYVLGEFSIETLYW
ncbi:MAG: hypothetical protein Hyperionvirus11_38 [Hyperionvirus sp.]|uniref:Uncharacterized protein n=1 Tax=Hyperionvirus sp. TaxID=2487770 RepID=A0A3G5A958_9VIRU|nr:MAG: hypothetical protein Hyperionvirus11_38 [Hyperionvirus sp.]